MQWKRRDGIHIMLGHDRRGWIDGANTLRGFRSDIAIDPWGPDMSSSIVTTPTSEIYKKEARAFFVASRRSETCEKVQLVFSKMVSSQRHI